MSARARQNEESKKVLGTSQTTRGGSLSETNRKQEWVFLANDARDEQVSYWLSEDTPEGGIPPIGKQKIEIGVFCAMDPKDSARRGAV
jgi:hypothetical protein